MPPNHAASTSSTNSITSRCERRSRENSCDRGSDEILSADAHDPRALHRADDGDPVTHKIRLGKGFAVNTSKDGKAKVAKKQTFRSVSDAIAAKKKPKKRFVRA